MDYDANLRAFAVVCLRSEPSRVGEEKSPTSSLKLLSDKTFDCTSLSLHWPYSRPMSIPRAALCQFDCQTDEEITTVQMIPSSDGDTAICIGTVIHILGEKEPSQGRLLVFNAKLDTQLSSNKRQLKQISDINVKGCVYALAVVNGHLAAAIGPAVSFFPSLGSERSRTVTGLCIQS